MKKTSIARVRELYRTMNPDGHWFARFFGSRFHNAYQGDGSTMIYFVSSEKGPAVGDDRRFYSVRSFNTTNGKIGTEGAFQAYKFESVADDAAKTAARASEGGCAECGLGRAAHADTAIDHAFRAPTVTT